jgi:biotin carboxylase
MTDATLLIMGVTAGTSWGRDQIRRLSGQARRRGVKLVGADTPSNLRVATAEERSCVDKVMPLDVHDADACRAWAATSPGIDAVLTIRELAVYATAILAEELGLAGNDPEAVHRIRNKDLCRERLRDLGFPQPMVTVCRSAGEAERFMRQTGPGPWIVKPRDGLASIGVSVVEQPRDIPAALQKFGSPPPALGTLPVSRSFLIETFVQGKEFSAEGVIVAGTPLVLALTRKTIAEGFIGVSQRVPAGLDEPAARMASEAVARALIAVGITRGIFHVEFWLTESGIVLGEFHIRPAGDFIHALVEHTRPGLELYGALIDDLLGRTPENIPDLTAAAGVEFLLAPPGRVRAVHGWEEVTRHPSVIAADLQVAPGDVIESKTDTFTRPGVFVVGAETINDLTALIDLLRRTVIFDVE